MTFTLNCWISNYFGAKCSELRQTRQPGDLLRYRFISTVPRQQTVLPDALSAENRNLGLATVDAVGVMFPQMPWVPYFSNDQSNQAERRGAIGKAADAPMYVVDDRYASGVSFPHGYRMIKRSFHPPRPPSPPRYHTATPPRADAIHGEGWSHIGDLPDLTLMRTR